MSVQFEPLGSLTFATGAPNATGKQRPIRILFRAALSWITKICFTGAGRVTKPPVPLGCPRVVGIGLISSLPMIASSQLPTAVILFAGPNAMPAVGPSPLIRSEEHTSELQSRRE